jgi:transporter family-2 protein
MSRRGRDIGISLTVGVVAALQSRVNGDLGDYLDDGILAAWLSFAVGLLVVVALAISSAGARAGFARIRPALARGQLRRWQLLGGLGGAMYVVGQSVTVAALGVAVFTVATVAGQTGGGAGVDAVGLTPGGRRPITTLRMLAAVMAVLAVTFAVSGAGRGQVALGLIVLALVAGVAGALQAAVNGDVAEVSRSPLVASVFNFIVGLAGITIVLIIEHLVRRTGLSSPPAPWSDPLAWSGGLIGVLYTIVAAWIVRSLGVLLFGLCLVAGSLVGAVGLDVVGNGTELTGSLVIGVLLTFVAVVLAAITPAPERVAR